MQTGWLELGENGFRQGSSNTLPCLPQPQMLQRNQISPSSIACSQGSLVGVWPVKSNGELTEEGQANAGFQMSLPLSSFLPFFHFLDSVTILQLWGKASLFQRTSKDKVELKYPKATANLLAKNINTFINTSFCVGFLLLTRLVSKTDKSYKNCLS